MTCTCHSRAQTECYCRNPCGGIVDITGREKRKMPDAYNIAYRLMDGLRRPAALHVAFPPHPELDHPRHNAFVVRDEEGNSWWVSVQPAESPLRPQTDARDSL